MLERATSVALAFLAAALILTAPGEAVDLRRIGAALGVASAAAAPFVTLRKLKLLVYGLVVGALAIVPPVPTLWALAIAAAGVLPLVLSAGDTQKGRLLVPIVMAAVGVAGLLLLTDAILGAEGDGRSPLVLIAWIVLILSFSVAVMRIRDKQSPEETSS